MTSIKTCQELVVKYLAQLEGEFETEPSDDGCFVVTPFTRPDGEFIEFAVESIYPDHIRLSDMSDTLGYLYVNGLSLSRTIINDARRIARRHGVSLSRSEFAIEMENSQVGEALHRMIQTVLATSDLIQKRRPTGRVHFDEEVESLVLVSGVVYDTDYMVEGEDSPHTIRFHVNSGKNLLIQPLSPASEPAAFSWAERWAYRFGDIRAINDMWKCVAILDDRGRRAGIWTDRVLLPLREYAIPWTNKERLSEQLAQATLS